MKIQEFYDLKKFARQGSPALSNEAYFNPVIEKMLKYVSEDDVVIKVSHPIENANEDNSLNTSYARALVEAKIPGEDVADAGFTIGMGMALDKNVPEFISYAGYTVFSCTNLCISADEDVSRVKDNHKSAQFKVFDYIDGLEKKKQEFIQFTNSLQNKDISGDELEDIMGTMLKGAITNFKQVGSSSIVTGYKNILDKKSKYSIVNDSTNMWNVYNAITDTYSKKYLNDGGLVERPIKTKELTKLTKLVLENLN